MTRTRTVGRPTLRPVPPTTRVDGPRLLSRIDAMRQIGGTDDGGVTRLAFTAEDRRGRDLAARYLQDAGVCPRVDAAANLIGVYAGSEPGAPVLVLGSHLDTVPGGGALDGAYGVLAAIEVVRTLAEQGIRLRCPVAVVAFANEEGAHGAFPMWGSHAFAGALPAGVAGEVDNRGRTLADLVAGAGGDVRRLADAAWAPERLAGYLELHVEQGPVLERRGAVIGVVESITGRTSVDITVSGEANHAGTTPIGMRRDALVAASRLVLAVRDLADRGVVRVATVGVCQVEPNAWNVIPGTVRMRADLRDVDPAPLRHAVDLLTAHAAQIGAQTGTVLRVRRGPAVQPVACCPSLQDLVDVASSALGLAAHRMPSGAGHDAQVVGAIAPIGMIFVPSHGGISHSPAEATDPDHLVAGADVLLQTVLRFEPERGSAGA